MNLKCSRTPSFNLRIPMLEWLITIWPYTYNGSLDDSYSSFVPIHELLPKQKDSDVFLLFLSARDVAYSSEVNDDWYAAHTPIGFVRAHNSTAPGNDSVYAADEAAEVLGCQVHYEICGPKSSTRPSCLVSGGFSDLAAPNIPEDDEAKGIIDWFFNSIIALPDVIGSLMTSSLTSRQGLSYGIQGPLPNDQWQLEVAKWHNIILTSLQGIITSAIGPNDPEILKYFWLPPETSGQKYLCRNQKIRSSAYSNFSVLGLAIVLTVGGLIIVLGYTFEHIIALFENGRRRTKYSRLEWSANDVLQTQRMAHEELGRGTWENCAGVGAVPVTGKDQMLAPLDIEDPKHPRLKTDSASATDGKVESSSSSTQVVSNSANGESSSTQAASTGTNGENSLATPTTNERPSSADATQINSVSGEDLLEGESLGQPGTSFNALAGGLEGVEIHNGAMPGETAAGGPQSFEGLRPLTPERQVMSHKWGTPFPS
ncbi:MAG: hypothetical protein Q9160_001868 [Pyrenula sp. 1 TL-2023]